MELRRTTERGAHFVAAADLDAGVCVLEPLCVVEAVGAVEHCFRCKRLVSEEDVCSGCGLLSLCHRCRASGDASARHSRECAALRRLEAELESGSWDGVAEGTRWELLVLLLRWAIHRGTEYEGSDPFWRELWRGGAVPEVLLTHESLRGAAERACIEASASLVATVAAEHGACKATPAEIAQLLMICRVNGHGILDPATQTSIGMGFFPSGSGFNHDCVPNVDFLPGDDGRLRFVTIRPAKRGDELTIAYTDLVTQTKAQRQRSLREDYFFDCRCLRCADASAASFDALLAGSGPPGAAARVAAMHAAAESMPTLEEGLAAFQAAAADDSLPALHPLRYRSAHGTLIHAHELDDFDLVLGALRRLLAFHDACEEDAARFRPGPALPVARAGLLLQQCRALAALGRFSEGGRAAAERVAAALAPFRVDVRRLRSWAAAPSADGDTAVHDILCGTA